MGNENDDVLRANAGSPAANIPDLKKKEKERKKGGAGWSGARGAAGEFTGATGGTVARAAASAAGMAAEGAAAEAGGLWALLAGLTSTFLGRAALAAAALLLMAGAGLLGYGLMKGKGDAGVGSPDLGGISDSMRVRSGGGDRLDVAGKGDIRFDSASAAKAPQAAAVPAAEKPAEEKPAPQAPAEAADKPVPADQLAHNLSGAKLSSSLGGDFGSKNIFSGSNNAPKFGAAGAKMPKFPGMKGKLGAMQASNLHPNASAMSVNKGSANKAFGQARLAKGLSQQAATASTAEQAAAAAQGAFDQQQPTGGNLATSGGPGGGGDTPPSLGGGAPPIDTGIPTPPATPPSNGTDPGLQNTLAQIGAMANQAMSDIQTGTMMMVLGGILIAAGVALLASLFSIPAGIALIAAGTALLIAGMMKISEGKKLAAQAIAMGQQLASSIGDAQQGAAINYCTNNAVTTGTPMENCTPPDSITNMSAQEASASADANRVQQIPVGTAIITQ
ncbi:MAG: hypothetical protein ACHQ49_01600 [Elusimicrobiota bacterium]